MIWFSIGMISFHKEKAIGRHDGEENLTGAANDLNGRSDRSLYDVQI